VTCPVSSVAGMQHAASTEGLARPGALLTHAVGNTLMLPLATMPVSPHVSTGFPGPCCSGPQVRLCRDTWPMANRVRLCYSYPPFQHRLGTR